jgi:acyl-CoA thioester hydrolase
VSNLYSFHTDVRVRYIETDLQGHINFVHHFTYFGVGLTEYMRHLGYPYDKMVADGFDLVFVDAHASFHGPAYYDELLNVHSRIGEIKNTSMRFDFQVVAPPEARLVSSGDVTVVMTDHETRKKIHIPDHFRQLVAEVEKRI